MAIRRPMLDLLVGSLPDRSPALRAWERYKSRLFAAAEGLRFSLHRKVPTPAGKILERFGETPQHDGGLGRG